MISTAASCSFRVCSLLWKSVSWYLCVQIVCSRWGKTEQGVLFLMFTGQVSCLMALMTTSRLLVYSSGARPSFHQFFSISFSQRKTLLLPWNCVDCSELQGHVEARCFEMLNSKSLQSSLFDLSLVCQVNLIGIVLQTENTLQWSLVMLQQFAQRMIVKW